jgi:hypothetical protein
VIRGKQGCKRVKGKREGEKEGADFEGKGRFSDAAAA